MKPGETLQYKFSGLFQSVVFSLKCEGSENAVQVLCDAKIQLPILKKHYQVSTSIVGKDWQVHNPVHEFTETPQAVENNDLWRSQNVLDPVSFFLRLHEGDWREPRVKMLIGTKIVELDVHPQGDNYLVQRHDKDQKLFVRRDQKGISSLEFPIPILGSLSLKRF